MSLLQVHCDIRKEWVLVDYIALVYSLVRPNVNRHVGDRTAIAAVLECHRFRPLV